MSCSFRSATAYDPRIRDGLRCPNCGAIAWRVGGLSVAGEDDGSFTIEGLDAGRRPTEGWTCMACGSRADESSRASRLLARVLVESRFADLA